MTQMTRQSQLGDAQGRTFWTKRIASQEGKLLQETRRERVKYGEWGRSRGQAPSGRRLCKPQPASLQGPQCLATGNRKGLHLQLLNQRRLLLASIVVVHDQFPWPQSSQNSDNPPLFSPTLCWTSWPSQHALFHTTLSMKKPI